MDDPFIICILCLFGIAWSIWGCLLAIQLMPDAPTWRWKAFLLAVAGPAVWGCAAYRGTRYLRHTILHRLGLPTHGCCGSHQ